MPNRSGGLNFRSTSAGLGSINSEIVLATHNGYGSGNTKVVRFTNVVANNGGTDLTLTQSSTNGDSITINTAGIYTVSWLHRLSANADVCAIVNNSVVNIPAGQNDIKLLAASEGTVAGTLGDADRQTISCTFVAIINDVVRCVTTNNNVLDISQFRITRVN